MKKERAFGPDLTRAVSTVMVITAHFFLNIGFYEVPLVGSGMLLCSFLRMAFLCCIPAFIMLSGWLCAERRWSRRYLRGLLPVLATWVMAASLSLAYRLLWLHESFTALGFLRRVCDYSAIPYAWYVKMYIGLYLLMPFVNTAWRALDRREQDALLLVLVTLAILPTIVNLFGAILPDWWIELYPLAYYVAGVWLRERRPKAAAGWLLAGWLISAASGVAVRWISGAGGPSVWPAYSDTGGFFTAAGGVCLFYLLVRCEGARVPKVFRRCVGWVARLSLPAYLVSYIFDSMLYPRLNAVTYTVWQRLSYLPMMVPVVLLCSCLVGQLIDWGARALVKLVPQRREQKSEE